MSMALIEERKSAVSKSDRIKRPSRAQKNRISPRKLAANRRNSQKSTGPKSPQGKKRASQNSLKHGLCSQSPRLENECSSTYNIFAEELRQQLHPATPLQFHLFDQLTSILWRLQRTNDTERQLYSLQQKTNDPPCLTLAKAFHKNPTSNPFLTYSRYERHLRNTHLRLLREFKNLQKQDAAARESAASDEELQAQAERFKARERSPISNDRESKISGSDWYKEMTNTWRERDNQRRLDAHRRENERIEQAAATARETPPNPTPLQTTNHTPQPPQNEATENPQTLNINSEPPPSPIPAPDNFDETNPPPPTTSPISGNPSETDSLQVSSLQVSRFTSSPVSINHVLNSPITKSLLLLLTLFLCSCSPDHYVRDADLDVQKLVRDREKKTLDYTPQVDVPAPAVNAVPGRAYEKIPTSPIPPKSVPPIEAEKVVLRREPLGPDLSVLQTEPGEGSNWSAELAARYRPREPIGPPVPQELTTQFDLFAALAYAVQHSRAYQDQMEGLYTTALTVTLQRHLFTPRPFANTGIRYTGGQRTSDFKSAFTVANEVGVKQQLPYGGEVTASALVDFVNAIHGNVEDGETAALALTGSVPLLRGFGMVNLEPLISSERVLVYSVRDFEEFRRAFVVNTARSFFQLLAAQQGIRNRRINLATSIDLRERSQALYDANRLSALEVQRARQQELTAQFQLINAEESYQSRLDDFKLLIGMPVEEPLDVVPIEMQVNTPKLLAEDAVAMSQRYRLTLATAADKVDDALRAVKNSQNGLLPDLTFTASGTLGNEPNTPAVALQERTAAYSAGVTLDLPVDRLAERNRYRLALIAFQKAQRDFTGTKDAVTADVRDALRSLRAAQISLEIQRVSIELANRRVEFANIRLTQGAANSNRDVVEAQTDLLSAQDSYEQARSQLQISVLEYMRVTGTLRVDPESGTLGRVMDRAQLQANNSIQGR